MALDATVTHREPGGQIRLPGLEADTTLRRLHTMVTTYVAEIAERDTQAERDRLHRVLGYLAERYGTTGPDGRWVLTVPDAAMDAPAPQVSARHDRQRGLLVFRVRHG